MELLILILVGEMDLYETLCMFFFCIKACRDRNRLERRIHPTRLYGLYCRDTADTVAAV